MLPKVNHRSKHDMFLTDRLMSLSIVTTHNFFVLHKKKSEEIIELSRV